MEIELGNSKALFLIRTKKNRIYGPVSKETLLRQIEEGEREPTDEVCLSGEYWFLLHEKEESLKFLGIVFPERRKPKTDDEITETQTETRTETRTETLSKEHLLPAQSGSSLFRPAQPGVQIPGAQPQNSSQIEGPAILRGIIWALLGVLIFVLFQIFQMTRS